MKLARYMDARGDHFEMKFMVKCCKFVKRLVKIGTFEFPNPNFGPTQVVRGLRGQKCRDLGGRRTKIWDRGLQCSPSN